MTEDELKEIESKAISSWHRIPDLIAEIRRLQDKIFDLETSVREAYLGDDW